MDLQHRLPDSRARCIAYPQALCTASKLALTGSSDWALEASPFQETTFKQAEPSKLRSALRQKYFIFVRCSINPGPVGSHPSVLHVHSLEAGMSNAAKCANHPKCAPAFSGAIDTTARSVPSQSIFGR